MQYPIAFGLLVFAGGSVYCAIKERGPVSPLVCGVIAILCGSVGITYLLLLFFGVYPIS